MKTVIICLMIMAIFMPLNSGYCVENCCGLYSSGNDFPCGPHSAGYGNCTWYARYKRPEVDGICTSNAVYWFSQAQNGGLPTGQEPKHGSIAVFNCNHVAYVESVNSDGSFNVSEMGWDTWNCLHYATYTKSSCGGVIGFIFPADGDDDGGDGDLPDLNVSYVEGRFAGESTWRKELVMYAHETKIIELKTKVSNDGEAEADKDEFEVEYYFSTNRDFDHHDDEKIGDDTVNYDLEPEGEDDDSDTEEMDISTNDSDISEIKIPGTYYFFVYIDSDLEEEHSSNNTSDDDSDSDEYVKVTVLPTPTPPIAEFSAAPLAGENPLSVVFVDQSANSPTSWCWEFGDGVTSSVQNPSHTYASAGSFTVLLAVTNADGADTEIKAGYIVVSDPPAGIQAPLNLRIAIPSE